MTATDELRALLDERGVEWEDFDGEPTWAGGDGRMYYARQEFTFAGPTGNVTVYHLTPSQAIAATLGRGTCRMVVDNHHRVDKVETSWGCVCSACGGFHKFTHGEGWAFCPSCGREVAE